MKLLYATSISLPSALANRQQILATAKALSEQLGSNFILGVWKAEGATPTPVLEMRGSRMSPLLGLNYALRMRSEGITHLFCREGRLLFCIRFWARLLGVRARYIYEAHTIYSDAITQHVMKTVEGIVSISHGLTEDLISLGIPSSRICVLPDAVDLSIFSPTQDKAQVRAELGISGNTPVVVYAGSFGQLHPWKGVDVFLAAAALAKGVFQFVCIGGRETEIGALTTAGLPPNTTLHGQGIQQTLAAYMRAADILVLPNKKGYVMSEKHTSPLKLFEYMASGVPVIASDLPSIREIVQEEHVLFFTPNDPAALLEALEEVHQNPEAAKERAAKAYALVQEHSWDSRAQRMIEFMSKLG